MTYLFICLFIYVKNTLTWFAFQVAVPHILWTKVEESEGGGGGGGAGG